MNLNALAMTFLLLGLISCNSTDSVFTDETYQDTIKQNIGGLLIRDIHHFNDFNSFNYNIEYSYKDKNDSISKIGIGSFYGQEPTEDEQIIQFGNITVFKTSGDREKDFIFIGSPKNVWTKYEISSLTIQQTELWKVQNIDAQNANWDNIAKITDIDKSGKLIVKYEFAKKERIFSFYTGKRQIEYQIDTVTGELSMVKVLEL